MSKLLVAETALLVLCSAIALALVTGVVWIVRRRTKRGRRRRALRLVAIRHWLTPRRLALASGGLFMIAATGWWVVDWLHASAPATDHQLSVAAVAMEDLDGAEWVEVESALDAAGRQKIADERWRRGLPLLVVIGLLVAGWVALAHSGLLDAGHRGAPLAARQARKP
ncbi:MAG TPA: hypothetical protein VJ783_18975 [Pirellulales bacterium]|nr:hypothetical protein [Pirellulales bacterium]